MQDDSVVTNGQEVDLLREQLINISNKEDSLRILRLTGGKIAGFSQKKFYKAPEGLIKNTAKKQMQKIKDINEFLESFIEIKKGFSGLQVNEFIIKINLERTMTDFEKLTLFYLNYPDLYSTSVDLIRQNMNKGEPLLKGVVEIPLSNKLEALSNLKIREYEQHLRFINFHHPNKTELKKVIRNVNDDPLYSVLTNGSFLITINGFYLNLIEEFKDELEEWSVKDYISLIKLGLQDAIAFCHDLIVQNEELKNRTENNEKNLNNELKDVSDSLNEKVGESNELKSIINKMEDEIYELNDQYIKLSDKNDKNKDIIKDLKNELYIHERKMSSLQKSQLNNKPENQTTLFNNEKVYLFSKVKNSMFTNYLDNNQIIYFDKIKEIEEKLNELENDAVCFVNFDGVNSKETFQIEKPFNDANITYRVVSNGVKNIVRKIIYYLEGELHNEANKKD